MANILVIDDNPTNRETFADVLDGEGHTVLSAKQRRRGPGQIHRGSSGLRAL